MQIFSLFIIALICSTYVAAKSKDLEKLEIQEQAAMHGDLQALQGMMQESFRVGDIAKAKKFLDLARQLNVEDAIEFNTKWVDICHHARSIRPIVCNIHKSNDAKADSCKALYDQSSQDYVNCIIAREDNIEVAALYANGQLIQQDLWKAISYLCCGHDDSSVIACELQDMIDDLHKATASGKLSRTFDRCNYQVSTLSNLVCTSAAEDKTRDNINQRLKQISASLDQPQKIAYLSLINAADTFFTLRSDKEQERTLGLSHHIDAELWESAQKKWLLETISRIVACELRPKQQSYAALDNKMNELYKNVFRRAQKRYYEEEQGEFYPEDIAEVQKSFAAYRDAFAVFIAKCCPSVALDDAKSWVVEMRITQLECLGRQLNDTRQSCSAIPGYSYH